jgi:hypothetical protein
LLPDPHEVDRILPIKREVERKLVTVPGVSGVDVGLKEVGGEQTPTHAILVFVRSKGEYAPEDEIPRTIEGVPTDVIEASFEELAPTSVSATDAGTVDTVRYDPAQGGSCISPARLNDTYGTLGMLVKDAQTSAQLWLSAYHVMCVDSSWPNVDKGIVQPALWAGGNPATDTIGTILRGTYGQVVVPWGYDLYVDAAVCDISGRAVSTSIVSQGTPKGARNASMGDLVAKYGATTHLTRGQIVSTNFTVETSGTTFYYQYRAGPPFPGQPPLAVGGDSGAPVLDSNGYAIGLIKAGDQVKYTVINPIGQIFAALNLTM